MKKTRIAILLSLLLVLIVATSAFAGGFAVVTYTDTSARGFNPGEVGGDVYIANGDFSDWSGGYPVGWNVPAVALSPNWEVHFAQMDYTRGGGWNYAAGLFFRTGSAGSQYASMSQQVSSELVGGYYWVQTHITAWEYKTRSPYNAVAWYGFGDSDDPASVSEWRELFPDTYVCDNDAQICNHLGRHETVWIDAGSYMHVKMGMKFPDHQAWTVFGVDDISITNIDGTLLDDGFIDDGDVTWNRSAVR